MADNLSSDRIGVDITWKPCFLLKNFSVSINYECEFIMPDGLGKSSKSENS